MWHTMLACLISDTITCVEITDSKLSFLYFFWPTRYLHSRRVGASILELWSHSPCSAALTHALLNTDMMICFPVLRNRKTSNDVIVGFFIFLLRRAGLVQAVESYRLWPVTGRSRVQVAVSSHCTGKGKARHSHHSLDPHRAGALTSFLFFLLTS